MNTDLSILNFIPFDQIFAEAALYWIQHGMMFVIPYYLLRIGGALNFMLI